MEYFRKAKVVPRGAPFHELDWSACHVGGTIKMGVSLAKWRINAFCPGTIEWPDGKVQYFYYQDCDRLQ